MTSALSSSALAGKSILVTGASSGIGKAAALQFAQCGARVHLIARDVDRLDITLSQLPGFGHTAHAMNLVEIDVASAALQGLAQREGAIDGIFHSAGVGLVRPAKLIREAHLQEVLGASLGGVTALARVASSKAFLSDHGSIVLMSSVAGHRGQPGMYLYSASKGAIDAATRSLACEFAPRWIRVNSVVAGAVRTEMHDRVVSAMTETALLEYEQKHLLGFGTPADIASVAVFLLSDSARWVTGASWVVDGGYLAR